MAKFLANAFEGVPVFFGIFFFLSDKNIGIIGIMQEFFSIKRCSCVVKFATNIISYNYVEKCIF